MSDFDDEPTDDPAADAAAAAAPATGSAKGSAKAAPAADDDWDDDWDEEGAAPKRDLTIVYAVVAAAIVIVLAVVLTRPKDDDSTETSTGDTTESTAPAEIVKNWQGAVGDAVGAEGADAKARVAAAPGVYIWTDFQGWHVRANRPDDVVVTVAAPQVRQKLTDDYDDADEKGDAPFKTEAVVTIPAGDGAEGVGFDLGGSETATFTVTVDGQPIPASEIFLGGADGVADANPVTFTKS